MENASSTQSKTMFDNHGLTKVAVFAALLAVFSFVRIAIGPVPITLQNLAVMLAGIVLGPWLAALSVLLMLALTALGLPLLGGNGGLAVFVGPTAGYLLGFVVGAFIVGLIAQYGNRLTTWKTAIACVMGGMVLPYACGIPITALVLNQHISTAAISAIAFIPGDVVKVILATAIAAALWKAYPAAFPQQLRTKMAQ